MARGLIWLTVTASLVIAGAKGIGATNTSPQWVWTLASPGVAARAVATVAPGNVYITGGFGGTVSFGGTNLTAGPDGDIFVAKVDTSGQVLWAAQGRGTDSYANLGNGVAADSSGNVYVVGRFSGVLDFGSTNLNSGYFTWWDVFLAKFDPQGHCEWAWQGNSGEFSSTYGLAVAVDTNDDVVICGRYRYRIYFVAAGETPEGKNPFNNSDSGFVAKFDGAGQIQWVREIATYAGNWHDANALAIDQGRNIYVTGHFSRQVYFGDKEGLASRGVSDILWRSIMPPEDSSGYARRVAPKIAMTKMILTTWGWGLQSAALAACI